MDSDWHTKYVPVNALGSRPGRRTRYHLRCKKMFVLKSFARFPWLQEILYKSKSNISEHKSASAKKINSLCFCRELGW